MPARAAASGARERRPARRDQEAAPSRPIQRRRPTISVVSEMIKERRSELEPARGSVDDTGTTAAGPTGRPQWGPLRVSELVDQDQFPRRARGVSRDSERRAEHRHSATSGYASESRRANEDRPRASLASDRPAGEHAATCSSCGGTATLRFAPDPSRPVYCDACFGERRKTRRQPSARQ